MGCTTMRKNQTNIDYPFVRAWSKMMGSYAPYIQRQVEEAREENALPDAVFKGNDGRWHTLNDIQNPEAFKGMGIPVPDRLRYTALVWITNRHFEDEVEADIWL